MTRLSQVDINIYTGVKVVNYTWSGVLYCYLKHGCDVIHCSLCTFSGSGYCYYLLLSNKLPVSKKYIYTKQSNKRNNPNSKDKTITGNKETQMTGQHEPLWKPEVKSGDPEGKHFLLRIRHPSWCPPMSYQGMKRIHDNNIMAYRCH